MNKKKAKIEDMLGTSVISMEAVNVGISPAEKYHVITTQGEYLVKFTRENIPSLSLYKVLHKMYSKGINIVAATCFLDDKELDCTILIYDWIPGVRLDLLLKKSSTDDAVRLGNMTGKLLRQIHDFPSPPAKPIFSGWNRYMRSRVYLLLNGVHFPHDKEIFHYAKCHLGKIRTRKLAVTHQDFRPENVIYFNNKVYIVDIETVAVGDPYSDFVHCLSMQPEEHRTYSKALIDAYFSGDIPHDFWDKSCIYGILKLMDYAVWKHKTKNKTVYNQAEHLFYIYNGLKTSCPMFWMQ